VSPEIPAGARLRWIDFLYQVTAANLILLLSRDIISHSGGQSNFLKTPQGKTRQLVELSFLNVSTGSELYVMDLLDAGGGVVRNILSSGAGGLILTTQFYGWPDKAPDSPSDPRVRPDDPIIMPQNYRIDVTGTSPYGGSLPTAIGRFVYWEWDSDVITDGGKITT